MWVHTKTWNKIYNWNSVHLQKEASFASLWKQIISCLCCYYSDQPIIYLIQPSALSVSVPIYVHKLQTFISYIMLRNKLIVNNLS